MGQLNSTRRQTTSRTRLGYRGFYLDNVRIILETEQRHKTTVHGNAVETDENTIQEILEEGYSSHGMEPPANQIIPGYQTNDYFITPACQVQPDQTSLLKNRLECIRHGMDTHAT